MRLLLDTHAFLWFVTNNQRLSTPTRALIIDPSNEILISPATFWEVAIKVGLGKYPLSVSFDQFFQAGILGNDFTILPIEISHATVLAALPLHHKDPFDRMIVARAIVEQIPIISIDTALDAYGVTRLW